MSFLETVQDYDIYLLFNLKYLNEMIVNDNEQYEERPSVKHFLFGAAAVRRILYCTQAKTFNNALIIIIIILVRKGKMTLPPASF